MKSIFSFQAYIFYNFLLAT